MKLSIVIPAHNESVDMESTVLNLHERLATGQIDHEILVVNDHSTDGTEEVLAGLCRRLPAVRRGPSFLSFLFNAFAGLPKPILREA